MTHERDSSSRVTAAMALLTAGSLWLAACGQDVSQANPQEPSDPALFTACAESRGSLLELDAMVSGSKRVDTSTLEHGLGMLSRLAERVAAASAVRSDLDRWKEALATWDDQRRAMEPTIENGRLIEPDTSALDQALRKELQAVGKPLAGWLKETCEDVRL